MTPEQELDLMMAEPSADDHVIRFKLAFPGSPKTYSYVGLKAGHHWYLTGRDIGAFTWEQLIHWIKSKGTLVSIERATEWENIA